MIPIGTDRPQRRFPLMNVALIAANVLIYFFSHQAAMPVSEEAPPLVAGMTAAWAKYMLTPAAPHLYQFITYQFLHESLGHLFFNMLFLYVFGNNLEEKLGKLGYLAFYLTGGVLAGCGQMIASGAPTLGASGSISAVAGLFLVLLPRTHIRLFVWFYFFMDIWEIPSIYFVLFMVAKDIVEPIFWGGNGTAYAAHLTGSIAGFLIGLLLLATQLVQRDHYDLLAAWNRYRRRKQYESVVAAGYNPFGPDARVLSSPVASKDAPPPVDPRIEALRAQIGDLVHKHDIKTAVEKYLELRQLHPQAVLGMDDQLDISNGLMAEKHYPEAAAAYEDFLRTYPTSFQREQVMLILALIYSHDLPRKDRAIELFRTAIPKLPDEKQKAFAESELARLLEQSPGPAT